MAEPQVIKAWLKAYDRLEKTDGKSPASIRKLTGPKGTVYLKSSAPEFKPTTFSVKREKEVLRWLEGRLAVPRVLDYAECEGFSYMVLSEMPGRDLDSYQENPKEYVRLLARGIKLLQSVEIAACPFDCGLDIRLAELRYLLDRGLADTDLSHWEQSTRFEDPEELYQRLCDHRPQEEFVFSHGDYGSNVLVDGNQLGFIDLGRAGKADRWNDIAFAVRDLRSLPSSEKCLELFFDQLGLIPNWAKIEYFILLDEMF